MLERYWVWECDLWGHNPKRPDSTKKELTVEMVKATDAQQAVERLERELSVIHHKYQTLVNFYDKHNGTPCEQIRHQAEIADLQAQLAAAQAQVLEAQDGVNALLEASSDRCRKHEQQVAQLRENVSKIESELSEWKLASAANETGHLFRCARVNGKWSCAKGCPAAAHTTLRGLVREVMEAWVNGRKVCDGIPLSLRERVDATLPREGGAQEGEIARLTPAPWKFTKPEIPPDHPYEKPIIMDGSN